MDRVPAYADAVAALLDATPDDAVSRFDAELADAVEAGLDPATARTLRWWHRESVRAVRDHASTVLPPVIAALVASERDHALITENDAVEPITLVASSDEARRRTLVAGLLSLSEASA